MEQLSVTSTVSPPARVASPTDLFTRVATIPDHDLIAIQSSQGHLTYAELLDRATFLAGQLGSGPGSVLIYGHKQPAMVVAILAALRVGRAYVPADPSTPSARIARMIDLARPVAVIAAQPLPADLAAILAKRELPTLDLEPLGALANGPGEHAGSVGTAPRQPSPLDPAYILFTSGTTGDPKGVPVPYSALEHFVDWVLATYAFLPRAETFLNQVPYTFDVSIVGLFGALLTGGTLFSVTHDEIGNPRRLFARLAGAPLSVWVSTPSLVRMCLTEPRFDQSMLPRLRLFWLAGEQLPPAMVRQLRRRFPNAEVWNAYGPTEATVVVTAAQITDDLTESGRPLPIGWPLPGTRVWIADPADSTRSLPPGTSGEIVIGGPQVALGYLLAGGLPGTVAPPTATGPFFTLSDGSRAYRTGDLGHVDPADGRFYCHGRLDRQIKLHGYRVELEEVETSLRLVPGVGDAAVLVVDRDGEPDYLVAFVVPSDETDVVPLPADNFALAQLLRSALARRLPNYALPRAAHLVPNPPVTTSGKLDRRALRDRLA